MIKGISILALLAVGAPLAQVSQSAILSNTKTQLIADSSTSLNSELETMGIDPNKYSTADESQPSLITLVEWGYNPASETNFNIYFYVFNPQKIDFNNTGIVSMAFPKASVSNNSFSYNQYQISEISRTSDNKFIKYQLNNPSNPAIIYNIFHSLDSEKRRYCVSAFYLRSSSGIKGYYVGTEYDFTGYGMGIGGNDSNTSTLKNELSTVYTLHVSTTPIVSTLVKSTLKDYDFNQNFAFPYAFPTNSDYVFELNTYSQAFSLPKAINGLGDLGTLESAHFDYYKYRTNWILTTNNVNGDFNGKPLYDDYKSFIGQDIYQNLDKNGWPNYNSDSERPHYGYRWASIFDTDNSNSSFNGFMRYNDKGLADSAHSGITQPASDFGLFPKNLGLSYLINQDKLTDSVSISGKQITDDILNYTVSENSVSDKNQYVPRKGGYIPKSIVYNPSDLGQFGKNYGYFDKTVSNSDLLSQYNSFVKSSFETKVSYLNGLPNSKSITTGDLLESLFNKNPNYGYINGTKSLPMLEELGKDDYLKDPILATATAGYNDSLNSFVDSVDFSNENLYRLTYDTGYTTNYQAQFGESQKQDWGGWINDDYQNNVPRAYVGKTDAVLDFTFIDFTFKNSKGILYTLPAYNDPNDSSGGQPLPPDNDSWPWWAWLLLAIGGLGLIYLIIRYGIKGTIRAIGFVLLSTINISYIILIYWWLAIIMLIAKKNPPIFWFAKIN